MNPFAWIYRTLQFGGKTDHQDSNPHLSLSLLFEIHFLRHQSVEDIFGDEFQTIKFLFKYWPRSILKRPNVVENQKRDEKILQI